MKILEKWLKSREAKEREAELDKAPKTLDEAVQFLFDHTAADEKVEFSKEPEGTSTMFWGGMAMRNNWGLWEKGQPLTQWFREHRIWHADDMSSIIYRAFWCKLNDKPFNINDEVVYYLNYWADTAGQGFDGEPLENPPPRKHEIKLRNGMTIHIN
jgi:hypothetical protein